MILNLFLVAFVFLSFAWIIVFHATVGGLALNFGGIYRYCHPAMGINVACIVAIPPRVLTQIVG